ncbi:MAG: TIR domain-containing protein [Eubacteriales bacterium]|nr:TIR domain-containing protein [Eubacteriales bacterium]
MENNTIQQSYIYDAFISYRHTNPDILIAEKLHKLLETYKTPSHLIKQGKKSGLSRVFRDKEELPTSSDLNSDIEDALQQSRFLIVICSPRTPKSKWVNSEISRFKELHGSGRILAILIEGEPDESFPQELFGMSKENKVTEPLAADIRAENTHRSLKKLKTEKLRILAPILGCKYDELRQRHRERELRTKMMISTALSIFFLLFGAFTLYQLKLVKESEQKALSAESIALSEMSRYQLASGNKLEAMKLSLDALPIDVENPERPYIYEAEVALYNAFYSRPYQGRIILKGHREKIQHLEFSRDGSMLATASEDYSVIIWKTANGYKLTELIGHTGPVVHCHFNSDAKKLVTSSMDGTVRIWDTQTGLELAVFGDFKSLKSSVFSPDDSSIITDSRIGYQWWDSLEGKELSRFETDNTKYVECFNIENGLAVVTEINLQPLTPEEKYSNYVMNIKEGKRLSEIDLQESRLIISRFSADGTKLVTVVNDSVDVWDTQSGYHLIELDAVAKAPINVAFSPDGDYVVGESDQDIIYIWDSSSGKKMKEVTKARLTRYNWKLIDEGKDSFRLHFLPDLFASDKAVSFNSNGNLFVLYSSNDTVQIYSIDGTGFGYSSTRIVDGPKAKPQYALYSPDDAFLAVSYDDNSVCIYETHPGTDNIFSENICGYTQDIFNSEGTKAISNKEDGKLIIWDITLGVAAHEFPVEDQYNSLGAFSPDGRKIAGSYNDNKILLWDAETYMEMAVFSGHESQVTSLVFNHNAELLAAGSENGSVRVWNTITGKLLWKFENVNGSIFDMAFNPDGTQLATSSGDLSDETNGSADIWCLSTGKHLMALQYNSDGNGLNMDLNTLDLFTFKPQNVEYNTSGSKLICFSTTDTTVHIVDTATFTECLSIGSTTGFKGAVFSPDGLNIATLGINNFIEVLDAETGKRLMDFGSPGNTGYVIRYSHDGRWIMAVYFDGTHIYDVKTGNELIVLEQYEWYSDGGFSLDDQRVFLSTYGQRAYAWDLIISPHELARNAREYLELCGY